jgi:octaprenyl-diphosphate synthase
MEGFRDDALKILDTFDNVELKQGLEELVRFTTDRKF